MLTAHNMCTSEANNAHKRQHTKFVGSKPTHLVYHSRAISFTLGELAGVDQGYIV